MFIVIIGTRCSGKSSVKDYLVNYKGFTPVELSKADQDIESWSSILDTHYEGAKRVATPIEENTPVNGNSDQDRTPESFLSMHSQCSSTASTPGESLSSSAQKLMFGSPSTMLEHVTRRWQSDFVTMDPLSREILENFARRPFTLVVYVDAPLMDRYTRLANPQFSLKEFVRHNDLLLYGKGPAAPDGLVSNQHPLHNLMDLVNLQIINAFDTLPDLYMHLETLDLLNHDRLRPEWDNYFMTLASLASRRSNCMKRRVGAVLVRDRRIISTGYNGTPRGVTNCNEGGCARCNSGLNADGDCLCLHAEENALLEVGRERIGEGAVLYCNTCPCLKCTIKIIQTGVKEVIYNLSYKVDDDSARLFKEAGVKIRRHAPPP